MTTGPGGACHETAAYRSARDKLVAGLLRERVIRSKSLADAFRAVPREVFVPPAAPQDIYADTTIAVIGADGSWLTTSSQPAMMALMLEQLQAQPGDRILEIGTGTGYNAAILDRLVAPDGQVDSVEVEPEAAHLAENALRRAGCAARVHEGDGADGWVTGAPYDGILATVAVWDLPAAWAAQACPNARIVAPFTIVGGEYSMALEREGEDWVSRSLEPCAFVRFKGRLAQPDTRLALGDAGQPVLILATEPAQIPTPVEVHRWLQNGEGHRVEAFEPGAWDGLFLHLLQHHGPRHLVRAQSTGKGLGWQGPAVGLWGDGGIAFITASGRLESFGASASADILLRHLAAWVSAGRPCLRDFRFRIALHPGAPAPGCLPRFRHTLTVESLR